MRLNANRGKFLLGMGQAEVLLGIRVKGLVDVSSLLNEEGLDLDISLGEKVESYWNRAGMWEQAHHCKCHLSVENRVLF